MVRARNRAARLYDTGVTDRPSPGGSEQGGADADQGRALEDGLDVVARTCPSRGRGGGGDGSRTRSRSSRVAAKIRRHSGRGACSGAMVMSPRHRSRRKGAERPPGPSRSSAGAKPVLRGLARRRSPGRGSRPRGRELPARAERVLGERDRIDRVDESDGRERVSDLAPLVGPDQVPSRRREGRVAAALRTSCFGAVLAEVGACRRRGEPPPRRMPTALVTPTIVTRTPGRARGSGGRIHAASRTRCEVRSGSRLRCDC